MTIAIRQGILVLAVILGIFASLSSATVYVGNDTTSYSGTPLVSGGACAWDGASSYIGTWDGGTQTCTISQDVNQGIQIQSPNIALDCTGHNVYANGNWYVISVAGYNIVPNNYNPQDTYVTVKNCILHDGNSYGFNVYNANYNTFINNTVLNSFDGFGITGSNNTVVNNTVTGNTYGIYMSNAYSNAVNYNKIYNNTKYYYGNPTYDIQVQSGSSNNLTNNFLNGTLNCNSKARYSGITLDQLFPYYEDYEMTLLNSSTLVCPLGCGEHITKDTNLTADILNCPSTGLYIDTPGVTLDCKGFSINGTGNQNGIDLNSRSYVTIKNCNINNFNYGLNFYFTTYANITNNTVSNNNYGINLVYSANYNNFTYNTITNNAQGITLAQSNSNNVNFNKIFNNKKYNYGNPNFDIVTDAYSSGNNLTSNYYGGELTCADKSRFKGVFDGLSPYYVDEQMTTSVSVPAGCPPGCGDSVTNNYTLTSDLDCSGSSTTALSLDANDITLDCNGSAIYSPQSSNIFNLYGRSGITIKNCRFVVTGYTYAININGGGNIAIVNNTFTKSPTNYNSPMAVAASSTTNNLFTNNTIVNFQAAFYIEYGTYNSGIYVGNNTVSNNIIDKNSRAVYLYSTGLNNLYGNVITNSQYGVYGSYTRNNTYFNNTFINSSSDGIHFESSDNLNNISNNIIQNSNSAGIFLNSNSNNNNISNNSITNSSNGIYTYLSYSNALIGNNLANSSQNGINLYLNSYGNSLTNNTITDSGQNGISISQGSYGNSLINNTVTGSNQHGVYISSSNTNTLANNTLTSNLIGLNLYTANSNAVNYNKIFGNSLYEISSSSSNNNLMFNYYGGLLPCDITKFSGLTISYIAPYYSSLNEDGTIDLNSKVIPDCPLACGDAVIKDSILSGDLNCGSGTALVVMADDITLDCQGHEISGPVGIDLAYRENVTIKNCTIKNANTGISLTSSFNNSLIHNTLTSNINGIALASSGNNTITNNTLSGNAVGLWLTGSQSNFVNNNRIYQNSNYEISQSSSSSNNLTYNYLGATELGCNDKSRFKGTLLSELAPYYTDMDMTQTSSYYPPACPLECNKPATPGDTLTEDLDCTSSNGPIIDTDNMLLDCQNHSIFVTEGKGILINANGVTVRNCNIVGGGAGSNSTGIYAYRGSSGFSIRQNNMSSLGYAIYFAGNNAGSAIYQNNINNNSNGIYIGDHSNGNSITYNTITNTTNIAVLLQYYSCTATITDNKIYNNSFNIALYGPYGGAPSGSSEMNCGQYDVPDLSYNYYGGTLGCDDRNKFWARQGEMFGLDIYSTIPTCSLVNTYYTSLYENGSINRTSTLAGNVPRPGVMSDSGPCLSNPGICEDPQCGWTRLDPNTEDDGYLNTLVTVLHNNMTCLAQGFGYYADGFGVVGLDCKGHTIYTPHGNGVVLGSANTPVSVGVINCIIKGEGEPRPTTGSPAYQSSTGMGLSVFPRDIGANRPFRQYLIANNTVINFQNGIFAAAHRSYSPPTMTSLIENNTFVSNKDNAIQFYGDLGFSNQKVDVNNNTFINNPVALNLTGDERNINLNNNTMVNNTRGISFGLTSSNQYPQTINIRGNKIYNGQVGMYLFPSGASSVSDFRNNVVCTHNTDITFLYGYYYPNTVGYEDTCNQAAYFTDSGTSAGCKYACDFAPPAITITSPVNGSISNQSSVYLQGIATGGVEPESVSCNGVEAKLGPITHPTSSTVQRYFNATVGIGPNDGPYNITCNSSTLSGQTETATITVLLDMTPPVIESVQLSPSITSRDISISKTVSDASGVALVIATIRNSNGDVISTLPLALESGDSSNGTWTGTATLSAAADGYYTVEDRVMDIVFNEQIISDGEVLVDMTPPFVSLITVSSPKYPYAKMGDMIDINASAYDVTSGISLVQVEDVNASAQYAMLRTDGPEPTQPNEVGAYFVSIPALAPEWDHALNITSFDNANPANQESTSSSYIYDETIPQIFNDPVASIITAPSINITGTVNDNMLLSSFTINSVDVPWDGSGRYLRTLSLYEGTLYPCGFGDPAITEIATDAAGNVNTTYKQVCVNTTSVSCSVSLKSTKGKNSPLENSTCKIYNAQDSCVITNKQNATAVDERCVPIAYSCRTGSSGTCNIQVPTYFNAYCLAEYPADPTYDVSHNIGNVSNKNKKCNLLFENTTKTTPSGKSAKTEENTTIGLPVVLAALVAIAGFFMAADFVGKHLNKDQKPKNKQRRKP